MILHKAILCHVIIAILCLCCWSFPYLPAPLNVMETSRSQANDVLRRENLDYIQRREINDDTGSGGGLEKWKGISDDDDTGSGGGLGKWKGISDDDDTESGRGLRNWKGISDDDDTESGGGLRKWKGISDDDDTGSGGGLGKSKGIEDDDDTGKLKGKPDGDDKGRGGHLQHWEGRVHDDDTENGVGNYYPLDRLHDDHVGSHKKPDISKSTGDDDEAKLEGNNGVVFYGGHNNVHIKFPNDFGKKEIEILDNNERTIFDTKEMKGEQLQEMIRRNAKSTESLKEASTAGLKSNTGQITRDVLEVDEPETWKQ